MLVPIIAGGLLTILVAVFHTRFYSIFGWTREFEKISDHSRRILFTVHIALLLLFFGIGLFMLLFSRFLASNSPAAISLHTILFIFWTWRALWQIIYFKPPKNRRLVKMRRLHFIMLFIFICISLSSFIPLLAVLL